MKIYKLKHVKEVDEECKSTKLIGFFSSELKAKNNISYLKMKDGFVDYPNNFIIEECEIHDPINNNQIFYLTHSYELDSDVDIVSDLGVFATEKDAHIAQKKYLKDDLELKEHPNGFLIEPYTLDTDLEWQEGFFAYN